MKFPQALLFALCGILQCNLAVSTFCSGRDQIQLPAGSSKNFACPGTTNGQVRIRWETTNLNAEGFSDDEYFINVFDDADQVYRDGQHEDAAFGFSGTLGSAGGDNWVVQFACDLEVFFLNCEDGDFSFVLVDCGCPAGMEVDEECSISSLNSATDATCVPMATPNPTKAPVATPNPTRAPVTPSPTDGPGTDAPVTPSPTDVPAASPATPGGPGNCFSGETLVQVKNERSCNSYNEDGYLPYAALGLEFANLMDKQNLFVQVAMLSLVLLVIGVFLSIEVLFGAAHGPLLVFLIIPGIYRGYQMYGSRANKKGNAKKLV
ncbi:expressed unknown protein [Seminavis robusta]|uniref:Uncharacterized protein n=1 Tax=Seminavis robusta TaxID=568900 RepID=A0A9N8EH33_9STRA|nr:expressed unknown protein [Seminavis robusta]|eukprot:Sro939_g222470.1 n/a (320) ;mRNA; r:28090-29813